MFKVIGLCREGLPVINLHLKPGELVCLHGSSGCGKTQLLRSLVDLDCNQGGVRLLDINRAQIAPNRWRQRVAFLAAESRWWAATVAEHFPAGTTVVWADLGLATDAGDWRVERLSTGEKQRLAILRVLANQPEVLLLDEPTANLDVDNGLRVETLVQAYLQNRQASCLWVSHDANQCQRIASRVLTLDSDGLTEC